MTTSGVSLTVERKLNKTAPVQISHEREPFRKSLVCHAGPDSTEMILVIREHKWK